MHNVQSVNATVTQPGALTRKMGQFASTVNTGPRVKIVKNAQSITTTVMEIFVKLAKSVIVTQKVEFSCSVFKSDVFDRKGGKIQLCG